MITKAENTRKKLVPIWIKTIGWIFILTGVAVPILQIVAQLDGRPTTHAIFGLSYEGSPLHPMSLLISAIVLSFSVSAYGLLFDKSWGLKACLATGYGGLIICLAAMAYSLFALNFLLFRLELIVLTPYLMRLHKLRPFWLQNEA